MNASMELANRLYYPNDYLPTTEEYIKEAMKLFEELAKKGNNEANYQLGVIYSMGNDVFKADYELAIRYLGIAGKENPKAEKMKNSLTQMIENQKLISECAVCKRTDIKLFACDRCRCVVYCGRDHQVSHWAEHKYFCRKRTKHNPVTSIIPHQTIAIQIQNKKLGIQIHHPRKN
eukprot:TRINITY_DN2286_c0_g1_i2.p1 TRINITY_DN2286_c0_g1~~TRINITY_DN2286_c0_g1_i2.p1  ORF type:complete len:175 (-),score=36.26 TRINITY_DN2286_c0_g1_i2:952-1476(-)